MINVTSKEILKQRNRECPRRALAKENLHYINIRRVK